MNPPPDIKRLKADLDFWIDRAYALGDQRDRAVAEVQELRGKLKAIEAILLGPLRGRGPDEEDT